MTTPSNHTQRRQPYVPDMQPVHRFTPRPQPSPIIPHSQSLCTPTADAQFAVGKCDRNSCPPACAHAREATAFRFRSLGMDCIHADWTCPTAVIPAPTAVIPAPACRHSRTHPRHSRTHRRHSREGGNPSPRPDWAYPLDSPSPEPSCRIGRTKPGLDIT